MAARILTLVATVWLVTMPERHACVAADTVQYGSSHSERIPRSSASGLASDYKKSFSTGMEDTSSRWTGYLQCSFVRRQWFAGQCRVSQGRFYYDGPGGSACYDYSGPFRYRFIVSDTAIVGIDKRNNRGYALSRAADPRQYDDLYFSIHLFGQFLRGMTAAGDTTAGIVRGSVDSCVYIEKKTPNGSDITALARETGLPCLIESFDGNGSMLEQSGIAYNTRKNGPTVPSKVMVKKKWGDIVTADTLTLSALAINRRAVPDPFAVPPACRLGSFHDMQDGLFPVAEKRK